MSLLNRRSAPEAESLRAQLGDLQRDVEHLTRALDEARAAYTSVSAALIAKTAEHDATERDLRRRYNEALRQLGEDAPPAPTTPVDRRPEWSVQAENAALLKERDQLLFNCATLERRAREAERQSTAVLLGGAP